MKIYVDTNVIMDFLLGRDIDAFNLFMVSLKCKHFIVISDLVLSELRFQKLENESTRFLNLCESHRKISVEKTSEADKEAALKLLSLHETHFNDALHKVLAVNAGADCIVTKNIKDFKCFADISILRPDEL